MRHVAIDAKDLRSENLDGEMRMVDGSRSSHGRRGEHLVCRSGVGKECGGH